MGFATSHGSRRVALVVAEPLCWRLAGGLRPLVGPDRDFWTVDIAAGEARVVEQLQELQPAGVIMEFREGLTELVASLGWPVVVVLADILMEGVGSVNIDDLAVGRMAAEHLRGMGLQDLAYLGRELPQAPQRRDGFLKAAGRNTAVHEVAADAEGPAARRARRARIDAWLAALPRPAGVFAAHDPLPRELLAACARLGLRVPEDVAVLAASDDQAACELLHPGLSSVELPWGAVAAAAARLLGRMLAGEPPGEPQLVAPAGIRTRGSTDLVRVADPRLQRAVRFMQDRLGAAIGVADVARAAGLDRRALERLFRAQLDRSPKQVLTTMRAERARELLRDPAVRVGEAAERAGFSDSSRLAAAFRARFGKTPRQWRRG